MKKFRSVVWKICVVGLCISILMSVVPAFTVPALAAGYASDTYYYDRIGEEAQWWYNELKTVYDSISNEAYIYRRQYTHKIPDCPTAEQYEELVNTILIGEAALFADYPLYRGKARVESCGYSAEFGTKGFFYVDIQHSDIFSDQVWAQTEARIAQVVATVGKGDRYTKLRKLTAYLIDNCFYDPYLDAINGSGDHTISTRGHHYNQSVFGLMLENIAVCDGFSQSVKVFCDALGIPCIIVGNKEHAWNYVQMENGGWYRLDITNVCRLGWDADLPISKEAYFSTVFLNNNTLGPYSNPYMINVNNIFSVTDFPKLAAGQYIYSGGNQNFSYSVAAGSYVPGPERFQYRVNEDKQSCTITNYDGMESGDLMIPAQLDGYTVTAIDPYAFYYCTGFTGKLTVPYTVRSIGKAAFAGCYGLTSVTLPDGLKQIGVGAFIGCKALKDLTLPDLLGDIPENAFADCDGLQSVSVGSHIKTVHQTALNLRESSVLIRGPVGSAMHEYAISNGFAFEGNGTQCAFEPVGEKYGISKEGHFHYCKHGVEGTVSAHTNDKEQLECGDTCQVCGAEYCTEIGFGESIFYCDNAFPATCVEPEFTGDLFCGGCGNLIRAGEYIGEPLSEHIPDPNAPWESKSDYHFKSCLCGIEMDVNAHSGGAVDDTGHATCTVCGARYVPTGDTQQPGVFGVILIFAIVGVLAAAAIVCILIIRKKKRIIREE